MVLKGSRQIAELKPDLVFLDIQMPKLNGFEMLELIENPPEVIFITAHNEFAIQAFEMNAVDYLLKPYSKDRLVRCRAKGHGTDPVGQTAARNKSTSCYTSP